MRHITVYIVTCIVFTATSLFAQTLIDRIDAVVDKQIITDSELRERLQLVAMQNQTDPSTPGLLKQVFNGLINEKLILTRAILDSIEVKDEEVTRALDQQIQNFIRQVGSEQRVEQMYGKSIARIKREYRDEVKNQLLVQKIRAQREDKVMVTRRDVEEFFETYRDSLPPVPEEYTLSHIYIVPKADSAVETKTRSLMQAILDSLRAGGKFADFAKRYSIDGTGPNGGDLGWAKRGDYVREFEEAVFALKESELSGIIKTQFGFHIVQLLERRGESVHVRHILLRIEKGAASDSATVKQLREIRQRVLNGESFAELAKKYSEDEDTKNIGGDLGTFTADQLQKDFVDEIKKISTGEISVPLRTIVGAAYGYHIVWMRKRTTPHPMSLEEDYRRVEQLALYMKRNKMNEVWIEDLKKNIYVDIRTDDLK